MYSYMNIRFTHVQCLNTQLAYPVHVRMPASIKPDRQVWVGGVMIVRLVRVGKGTRIPGGHAVHLAEGVRLDPYIKAHQKVSLNMKK